MSQQNVDLILSGYRAFLAGEWDTISDLLDPEVEWHGIDEGPREGADRDGVLSVLAERLEDLPRVTLERCIGVGDRVVVYFRAAELQVDTTDDRPLQTRRYYTIGRYAGVITIRDGRVVEIQDYPHVHAALDAVGLAGEFT